MPERDQSPSHAAAGECFDLQFMELTLKCCLPAIVAAAAAAAAVDFLTETSTSQ